MLVVTDQLLRALVLSDKVSIDELNESVGMRVLLVLEVKSIMHFSDSDCLFMSTMLQNKLFEIQKCLLVLNSLSDLYL